MKNRIALFFLFAATLSAADQVVLKNGDTITGSVVKKEGAKLAFKNEFLGELTIPWTAIQSLKSDQELTVVLPSGESVKGKISSSGDNLAVAVAGGEKSAPLAGVTAVRNDAEQAAWEKLRHPGLLQLWVGNYDLGFALTRGNARTTNLFNAIAATRITQKDKIAISFSEIHATALLNGVESATASALHGAWAYDRNITPRFFLTAVNQYDHDRFQDLDLRAMFGGGAGWNAIKNDRVNLSVQGGGDYEREAFADNTSRNSGEINFGDTFLYKVSSAVTLAQDFTFFPNLTYTGDYRFNFNLNAVTAIKKWLGFHITFNDQYLSNPVLGRLRNDVILSTGFRLSFASK